MLVQTRQVGGEIVIADLPGHAHARRELACRRELVQSKGRWVVRTDIRPTGRGRAN